MTTSSAPPPPAADRRKTLRLAAVLAAATLAAYANSLGGAFVFDDLPSLLAENPTLRRLWPLFGPGGPLSPPPGGLTVSGRPFANLTFALNYAVGRFDPFGYHALNLAIHVGATLALFGLIRRTLLQPPLRKRFHTAAAPLAFCIALLWSLHPLQTEAVTYLVQRTESLASLCVLLTLYGFVRATTSDDAVSNSEFEVLSWPPPELQTLTSKPPRARAVWLAASVAACFLGMATKEITAATPLLVLLYDRTFVAGSFRAAWRERRVYYVALAATWLLLGWLVATNPDRSGTAGFDAQIGVWPYALTQCRAIVLYLKLVFWPYPLILDYGYRPVAGLAAVWPQALFLALALAATVFALRRRSPLGFPGAWFFLILAPSSSFVPVATQTIAEHRIYLSLAAVLAPVVLLAWMRSGRATLTASCAVAVVFGALTLLRNADYRSPVILWRDTVEKFPANGRAQQNLGFHLLAEGQPAAALARFEETLRLAPENRQVHFNIARALVQLGRLPEAIPFFEEALRRNPTKVAMRCEYAEELGRAGRLAEAFPLYVRALQLAPDNAIVHESLATTLARNRHGNEALPHFATALRFQPDFPEAASNLGDTLASLGRAPEAVAAYERSLSLQPTFEAHTGLAKILLANNVTLEALVHFEAALALNPDSADAHANLGAALARAARAPEAAAQFEAALRLDPNHADAHTQFGLLLAQAGRPADALPHFEAVVQLQPNDPAAAANLGKTLCDLGRFPEAVACLTQTLILQPTASAHVELANALLRCDRPADAIAHYEAALALDPGNTEARASLARLRSAGSR